MFSPLSILPWIVEDFSGGITDNYIDGDRSQAQFSDNFVITDNRKLLTRGGSEIVDSTNYLPNYTAVNARTNLIFAFEGLIFEQQGRDLYYNNAGYTTLVGPTGNKALPSGSAVNRTAFAYWNHHMFLVNDSFCNPQKLYKDGSNVFRIRNAGLPKLASTPTVVGSNALVYAFANDFKAKWNAHVGDASQHTSGADSTNVITSANATNLATLITLITEAITDYTAHEADSQLASSWAYHAAKATDTRQLASAVPPTNIGECVLRLSDLSSKFNAHDNDGTAHGVAASHQQILAAPVSRNYIYEFCYKYSYMVGTVTFEDFGATKFLIVPDVDMPSDSSIVISGIPVISNGATENWDTAVITCEIFRTIDAGQTSYRVGAVTNGTTTFTDTSSDDTIQNNNVTIYTDGDVVDNDPPPKAKYMTVANDIGWYAHVKEGTEVHTNRIRQSIKFDIDSCPESFFLDVEDEIMGIGNINIYPIVFCEQRIYRLEGYLDELGRGFLDKREISRVVGCVSHLSIVVTLEGLFFAGTDGFYWTDGYQCVKVSQEFNARYADLSNKANLYGAYDSTNKRVYWAAQSDSSSADNDCFYIADIKFGIKPNTCFTNSSGGTSFSPTALLFFDGDLYRADRRGYLFKHLASLHVDPRVDILSAPDTWRDQVIIYNYKSAATNFGRADIRKWVPKISLYAKNLSNISIGINSYNDDSTYPYQLKEVRVFPNVLWGTPNLLWGDALCIWNLSVMLTANRRFPARGLRCSYKQIQFTNAYTIITSSDKEGTADVDAVAKTVTINGTNVWPTDAVDYYISFEVDDYAQEFLIDTRSSTVLTYIDNPNFSSTATGSKWLIKGYRKNDILNLLNYTIFYGMISDTQKSYHKSDSGANV